MDGGAVAHDVPGDQRDGLSLWRPSDRFRNRRVTVRAHSFFCASQLVLLRGAGLHRGHFAAGREHFFCRVSNARVTTGARPLFATTVRKPRRSAGVLKWHCYSRGLRESPAGGLWWRHQPADSLVRGRRVPLVYTFTVRNGSALAQRKETWQG